MKLRRTALTDATIRAFAQDDVGQLERITHLQLERYDQEGGGGCG